MTTTTDRARNTRTTMTSQEIETLHREAVALVDAVDLDRAAGRIRYPEIDIQYGALRPHDVFVCGDARIVREALSDHAAMDRARFTWTMNRARECGLTPRHEAAWALWLAA